MSFAHRSAERRRCLHRPKSLFHTSRASALPQEEDDISFEEDDVLGEEDEATLQDDEDLYQELREIRDRTAGQGARKGRKGWIAWNDLHLGQDLTTKRMNVWGAKLQLRQSRAEEFELRLASATGIQYVVHAMTARKNMHSIHLWKLRLPFDTVTEDLMVLHNILKVAPYASLRTWALKAFILNKELATLYVPCKQHISYRASREVEKKLHRYSHEPSPALSDSALLTSMSIPPALDYCLDCIAIARHLSKRFTLESSDSKEFKATLSKLGSGMFGVRKIFEVPRRRQLRVVEPKLWIVDAVSMQVKPIQKMVTLAVRHASRLRTDHESDASTFTEHRKEQWFEWERLRYKTNETLQEAYALHTVWLNAVFFRLGQTDLADLPNEVEMAKRSLIPLLEQEEEELRAEWKVWLRDDPKTQQEARERQEVEELQSRYQETTPISRRTARSFPSRGKVVTPQKRDRYGSRFGL